MAAVKNPIRRARRVAFAAGVAAALALALAGRVPAGSGPLPLDLTVATGGTGELATNPSGRVADAEGLLPGSGSLAGQVQLMNETDAPLLVHVSARPTVLDASGSIHVELRGVAGVVYSGTLAGLSRFSRGALALAPRRIGTLSLRAWLPRGAASGWSGRSVSVSLEYRRRSRGRRAGEAAARGTARRGRARGVGMPRPGRGARRDRGRARPARDARVHRDVGQHGAGPWRGRRGGRAHDPSGRRPPRRSRDLQGPGGARAAAHPPRDPDPPARRSRPDRDEGRREQPRRALERPSRGADRPRGLPPAADRLRPCVDERALRANRARGDPAVLLGLLELARIWRPRRPEEEVAADVAA